MTVAERLASAGLTLPEAPAPVAVYVPGVRSGSHVFTSGQLPFVDGELAATGKVGDAVDTETAAACARQCALNALAVVAAQVDLDQVVRVVKATVFVASATDFTDQAVVANGASELLGLALGDAGRHARSAVGVAVLPMDAPVEVELVVEVA